MKLKKLYLYRKRQTNYDYVYEIKQNLKTYGYIQRILRYKLKL